MFKKQCDNDRHNIVSSNIYWYNMRHMTLFLNTSVFIVHSPHYNVKTVFSNVFTLESIFKKLSLCC